MPLSKQGRGLRVGVIAAHLGCELAVYQQRTQAKSHKDHNLQEIREGMGEMRLGVVG